MEQLSRDVEMPPAVSAYGVKEADLPKLSEVIAAGYLIPFGPRTPTAKDILKICKAAM